MRKTRKSGGKVIASGAYGCVFDPSLKCNNKTKREKGKITKLMMNKNALKEFVEIAEIDGKLRANKNYKDYFLTYDVEMCTPSKLTTADLTDFSTKCKILPDITRTNINTRLENLTALNMPYGGMMAEDYMYANGSFEKLNMLHRSLVKLLKNGIVPMNKKHLYHSDIKILNVLVEENGDECKTRLIDWGLFTEYIPHKDFPFPRNWTNRPLQFNVPFSVILFSDKFIEKYDKYLKDGGETTEEQLKPFVVDYIDFWRKSRGEGHFAYINSMMYTLFSNDLEEPAETHKDVIEKEYTMDYIVNYLVDVLIHFTRYRPDGSVHLREYIDNIYINIVDIWGFITIYYSIIEMLQNSYSTLTPVEKKLFNQLRFIFVEYLYNPRHEPIDMKELYKDLGIAGKFFHLKTNRPLETYKSPSPTPTTEMSEYKPKSRTQKPKTL